MNGALKRFLIFIMFTNILGFHYTIMQWIWVGVNLSWIYAYGAIEWANDMKLDVFAVQNKTNI